MSTFENKINDSFEDIKVIKACELNEANLSDLKLTDDMLKNLCLEGVPIWLIDDEEYSNITIEVNTQTYNIIHGFPGDNPVAIIVDYTNGKNSLLASFAETLDLCIREELSME